MKKRALQITLVDPRTSEGPDRVVNYQQPYKALPTVTQIDIQETLKTAALCVGGVFATYMAADALRQISIYTVIQKVQPKQLVQFIPDGE